MSIRNLIFCVENYKKIRCIRANILKIYKIYYPLEKDVLLKKIIILLVKNR